MIEYIELRNLNLGTRISINKSVGDYWLDQVDFGQVESVIHTFKFINQIGETIYNTTLEPRSITISGWVAAWDENTVHRLKRILNGFCNPVHTLEAIVNEKKIQFQCNGSIKYSATYKENNELICKFLIQGYCAYPLFTDESEHVVSVASTEGLFKFPLIIPEGEGIMMGIRQPTLIAEVKNNGDLPVGYTIEFQAFGTVVNPILTDIGSQQFIKINKTLTNGEIVTVDTREGYRMIHGILDGKETNYFKYRSYDSGWLSLQPGTNYLRYNADSGVSALEVYIRYSPGYLEVDE